MADPAQIPSDVGQAISGTVAAAGGAGTLALGWFAWFLRRVFGITIPRLADSFQKAIDKVIEANRVSLAEQRADFREEMKQTRADFKDALREMHNDVSTRIDKLATAVERFDNTMRSQGK